MSGSRFRPRPPSCSPTTAPRHDIVAPGGQCPMSVELTPAELKERLDQHAPIVLLDVRQDWETRLCKLDNAVHIPIEEIEHRTDELDPTAEIVVYCHQGVRSAAVAEYLRSLGFANARNLAGASTRGPSASIRP